MAKTLLGIWKPSFSGAVLDLLPEGLSIFNYSIHVLLAGLNESMIESSAIQGEPGCV